MDTLQVPSNLVEGSRVAINIEGSNFGGIGHAQLLFEELGEVGRSCTGQSRSQPTGPEDQEMKRCKGGLPSEAIEAPERRNNSEPIWIEKTFSEGKLQGVRPDSVMM